MPGGDCASQYDRSTWPDKHARYAALFKTRSRDEWAALFEGTDACVAPVLTVAEAETHPHNAARGTYQRVAGVLQASTAKQLGLAPDVLVSAGGGDNMMGAIGTGNTREGVITASFGTSGTIYACAEKPVIDPKGEIAAFCDSTNRWLPLLCTMNVTVATEMMRLDFGYTHETFASKAATVPAGSNGLLLLPYLEGPRHVRVHAALRGSAGTLGGSLRLPERTGAAVLLGAAPERPPAARRGSLLRCRAGGA
ncbi:MAG: hypothetical protein HC937_03715, partial [Aquincola sp.]|nr:hypothetical protein [Aquincola sp.]